MEKKKSYLWLAILLTVIVSLVVTAAIVLINHRNERGNENINGEVMKEEGETDKTVPEEEIKQVNVMAADSVEVKAHDEYGYRYTAPWTDSDFYGTGISREKVKSITFLDSLEESEERRQWISQPQATERFFCGIRKAPKKAFLIFISLQTERCMREPKPANISSFAVQGLNA